MRLLLLTIVATILGLGAGKAETRVALVIGNSAYANIGSLINPVADARLIAGTLEGLGFETTLVLDADKAAMTRSIAEFGRGLRVAGPQSVGLFYFAGHEIQTQGSNYLMPVEANPIDEADLDLESVDANWVLRQMESAGNQTNILILDACRNNPFAARKRSISRGLARIDAPTGSFLAYATAPGDVAEDGDAANSPFSMALAKHLPTPGKPIEQIFKQVRVDVLAATGGVQTPWDSSSLVQDFYFKAAADVEAKPVELSLWQSVSKSGDAGRIALFLQVYPESRFAAEAQALLAETIAKNPDLVVGSQVPAGGGAPAPAAPVAAVTPPAPAAPSALSEHEMIALAQASGLASDYQNYVAAYPDGVFVDLARAEIAHLGGTAPGAQTEVAALTPPAAEGVGGPPLFDRPLGADLQALAGQTLHELARGSPMFPPIEGLDEAYWHGQPCSNCHNWTRENLCDQGKTYVGKDQALVERVQHPYGGGFKRALLAWAAGGCQ